MKRANFPARKDQRRVDAAARQAIWDALSPEEKIAREQARSGACILTEADILAGRDDDCTTHGHEVNT